MDAASLRVFERNALMYRRMWRGSITISFITPVLFLTAMGAGLGTLVQNHAGGIAGHRYIDYIAPGLLAASSMQTATNEMAYPVLGKLMWQKVYEAMLSTPLAVRHVVIGEALWLGVRLSITASLYFAAMLLFGTVHDISGAIAIPAAVATGMAFGLPVLAFSATRTTDAGYAVLFRFLILPLFLLSGTFFAIDQLPRIVQVIAWLLPLAHGTALARDATLAGLGSIDTLHAAVVITYVALGYLASRRLMERRLRK